MSHPIKKIALWGTIFFIAQIALGAEEVGIRIRVQLEESRQPLPCVMRLAPNGGEWIIPQGYYDYRKWFPMEGEILLRLPKGRYVIQIRKGPEWIPIVKELDLVEEGQRQEFKLRRWIDMNRLGWWSGDMHIHRPVERMDLLVRAEDLNVAPVLTLWNQSSMFKEKPIPRKTVIRAEKNRYYSVLNEEHEKQGGAVLCFNLKQAVDVAGYADWYPDALGLMQETRRQGGHVEIEKPFWLDFPLWLALGGAQSVGVVNNHFMENRVMNNSAWGRPREATYSQDPAGLAYYVMDLYYKALNCGFRLPATGGAASGVLDSPVGQNRTYVYLERGFSYDRWFEAMEAGRCFATNGPMVFAEVNGKLPGATLRRNRPLRLQVRAASLRGITAVEWIADGTVAVSYSFPVPRRDVTIEDELSPGGRHWLALRVFETGPAEVARFAQTSPFYLEGEDPARRQLPLPKRAHPDDVQFFIDWLNQRIEATQDAAKIPDEAARQERLKHLAAARDWFIAKRQP